MFFFLSAILISNRLCHSSDVHCALSAVLTSVHQDKAWRCTCSSSPLAHAHAEGVGVCPFAHQHLSWTGAELLADEVFSWLDETTQLPKEPVLKPKRHVSEDKPERQKKATIQIYLIPFMWEKTSPYGFGWTISPANQPQVSPTALL